MTNNTNEISGDKIKFLGKQTLTFCFGPYNTYDWIILSYQLPFNYGYKTIIKIADFIIANENFKLDLVQKTDRLGHSYVSVSDISNNSLKTSEILKKECAEITITGYVKEFKKTLLQIAFTNQTNSLIFRIPKSLFTNINIKKYTKFANKICTDILEKYKYTPTKEEINNNLLKEGRDMMNIQNFEKAIKVFSDIINHNQSFEQAYFYRAISYELLSNFEKAILDYKKILELNPFNDDASYNLSLIYYKIENYKEALKYLKLSEQAAMKNYSENSIEKYKNKIIEIENILNNK